MKKDNQKRWHYQIMTLKQNNESAIPAHYKKDGQDLLSHLEHILPEEEMRGSYRFNIMKYATRAGRKDDINLEIDKIIEYAKRWKKFEESIKNSSQPHKEKMWTKKEYGDFKPVLQFVSRYYDGEEILYDINSYVHDGDCLLMLDGNPAWINGIGFIVPTDTVVYYAKEQLTEFFKDNQKDEFIGLEILVKKQKGQENNIVD